MGVLQAVFLGFLQGVTEFLPVSSSGHLALFKNLFGLSDVGIAFDILLHIGTLIAVFAAYWKDVVKLFANGIAILIDVFYNVSAFFKNLAGNRLRYRRVVCTAYRKFVMLIVVSTIPTAVIAILTGDIIEASEKTLIISAICLLITGVLLLIADELPEGMRTPKQTSYLHAVVVGMVQGLATLPGISRSGSTITACLGCGFRKDFAVKYSFLMSIPAILGAGILKLGDLGTDQTGAPGFLACLLGMIVAAAAGYICIKTMLVVVRRKKYRFFAYYCFIVGGISFITYFVK